MNGQPGSEFVRKVAGRSKRVCVLLSADLADALDAFLERPRPQKKDVTMSHVVRHLLHFALVNYDQVRVPPERWNAMVETIHGPPEEDRRHVWPPDVEPAPIDESTAEGRRRADERAKIRKLHGKNYLGSPIDRRRLGRGRQ